MTKKVLSLALISTVIFSLIIYSQINKKVNLPESTKSVVVIKKEDPIMALKTISFTLKGINGTKYKSSDIFNGNKLTMINFWGTLCNPCIKELPELQELNDEMESKNFGIIGIIGDATSEESLEDGAATIEKKGISYANLIPDKKIEEDFISKMTGYPVSIFVDKNGNIVGEVITGARSKVEYKKIADKILSTIK
ncbi:TlpA family protein disulfide reductase [Clostridium tagluense]|uniref:TlpA family protein disulfide reductase n=1 Tax=Clostridium tagluense TaxID=360422 RepID=UPI001C6E65BB|nr:TlpA disulfide reductase family protein [Clostridium tagluense]MBW9155640.1 TlpA family protein disulfide reductase [Clostridium tagluense]WLC65243.1 TlpA family protein disulfide reductase [Clostridium tagluense]